MNFHIKSCQQLDCYQFIVYKFSCGNCYVGETTTHFISRINEQSDKDKKVQHFSTSLQLASTIFYISPKGGA